MYPNEQKILIQKEVKPYSGSFDESVTFGIEIEFLAPVVWFESNNLHDYSRLVRRNQVNRTSSFEGRCFVANKLRELTGFEFTAAEYSSRDYSHWQIKSDCSVKSKSRKYIGGFELVSPVLSGHDGLAKITKICNILKALGCKTNGTCGTHVHYGIGSFFEGETETSFYPDINSEKVDYICKNIADTYLEYEAVIDRFVDSSRNDNGYCKTIKSAITRTVSYITSNVPEPEFFDRFSDFGGEQWKISSRQIFTNDRYCKVNFCRLLNNASQTVEVRQLEGTLDAKKICTWIFLNQRLIHKALSRGGIENRNRSKSFDNLTSYLQWTDDFCGNDREIKKAVKNLRHYGHFHVI